MTPIDTIIWICVFVFGLTALVTLLALVGVLRLGGSREAHERYLRHLFRILIVQIVVASVSAFIGHLKKTAREGPEPPLSEQPSASKKKTKTLSRDFPIETNSYFRLTRGQVLGGTYSAKIGASVRLRTPENPIQDVEIIEAKIFRLDGTELNEGKNARFAIAAASLDSANSGLELRWNTTFTNLDQELKEILVTLKIRVQLVQ